jgi:hypothetical protein
MWDEEKHPRDDLGRFTKKELADMSADELKEYILSNDKASGAASGARYGAYTDHNDPDYKAREKFANDYYDQILHRNRDAEITAVAQNTNMSYQDIEKIFAHVFELKHLFKNGRIKKFDPDYDMAQSWFRLREGKNIKEHDLILLKHELMEAKIMVDSLDIVYEDVHAEVEKIYNYRLALIKYKKENNIQ